MAARFEMLPAAADDAPAAAAPAAADDDDALAEWPEHYDLAKAQDAKLKGNAHFGAGEWQEAIDAYTEAIMWAPPDAQVSPRAHGGRARAPSAASPRATPPPRLAAQEKAVYHCNRAACFLKLEQHEAVVDDSTNALAIDADYVKALSRRAQAYEALDKLTEALADAKRIAELEPDSKPASAAVRRLEGLEAAKLEREKEEMMGKLKDLGNMFLGNFGLSLDNFKATKDEGTGSYNIAYDPAPGAPAGGGASSSAGAGTANTPFDAPYEDEDEA